MKKSRHLPFYLPNNSFDRQRDEICDPEDNLYNNPNQDENRDYVTKKQSFKNSKNDEKERFDEI